jgi:hypothetical protein
MNAPTITVWVHGTRFSRNPLFYSSFNGKPGLKPVDEIDHKHYLYTAATTLYKNAPESFPLETFYIFGWSGKLSFNERQNNASILLTEIKRLETEYIAKHNVQPTIQLISHSHGGNIVLNVPSIARDTQQSITINKLILLACPVQAKTMDLIKDPMFERVYSLYSSLDFVQILAPQIVYKVAQTKKGKYKAEWKFPPFSDRRFPHHSTLAQIKIKMDGRAIMHGEFTLPNFLATLQHIINHIDSWYFEQHQLTPHLHEREKLLCIYTHTRGVESV